MWGALSDDRMSMSFLIVAGPRQRSHSRVPVRRNSWPYFSVSDSRLQQPGEPGPRIYIPQEQGGGLPNITRIALYSVCADRTENSASIVGTCLPNHCIVMVAALTAQNSSHVIASQRIHWCAACFPATSNKHSCFYCCLRYNVCTESLATNALTIHVTVFSTL
jgi:hypothetical protein